ncbi:hypothetical protein VNI00_018290 [Paramarasmius palmivorus]|uniref:Uncharacterized protein n=1 Tax=Paramarasmius palmivorus TaxID=297713 RepID=A0AAW0AZE6_9AGAR
MSEGIRAGFKKWRYTSGVAGCEHGDVDGPSFQAETAVEDFLRGLYPLIHQAEQADQTLTAMREAFGKVHVEHPSLDRGAIYPVAHIVTIIQDCMNAVEYICLCDDVKFTLDFAVNGEGTSVWTTCKIMVPAEWLAEVKEEVEVWHDDDFKYARLTLNIIAID